MNDERVVYMLGVLVPDTRIVQRQGRSAAVPAPTSSSTYTKHTNKHVMSESFQSIHVSRMAHADRENAACSRLFDIRVR